MALIQSMTASSCSASLSSKHSKMSTSAMSVIAATLTSHMEVSRSLNWVDWCIKLMNDLQVIGEGDVASLDDFTSLLTESDARLIVDLLKLAVADRIENESAKDILSSVLTGRFSCLTCQNDVLKNHVSTFY